MNDKQNNETSAGRRGAKGEQGIPDMDRSINESTGAIDSRAKDSGQGDRTDAPDMHDLDNVEEK